jgi:hypothetical protein
VINDKEPLDLYVYVNNGKVAFHRAILTASVFFFTPEYVTHHFHQRIFQPHTLGRYASGRYVIRADFHDKKLFSLATTPILETRIEACARWFCGISFLRI